MPSPSHCHPFAVVAFALLSPLPCLWAQSQFETVPVTPWPQSAWLRAIVADVDGDGDLDAFGVGPFGSHRLLRNDGHAGFVDVTATSLPPPTASAMPSLCVLAFDMDGDGDLDLFAGLFGPSTAGSWLLRNNGNGTFADASANLPPGSGGPQQAVARDFDGDGDLDVAFASNPLAGSRSVLLTNDGTGVFTLALAFNVGFGFSIATADFDGDHDDDVVLGDHTGPHLLRNDGNLVFTDVTAALLPTLPSGVTQAVAFGDIDGDGDADLAVARGFDYVLRNTGSAFVAVASLGTTGTRQLVFADVDEDGDLDLFRAFTGGPVALAINDGNGGFTNAPNRLPASGITTADADLSTGDLDGDGDLDALIATTTVGLQFSGPVVLRNLHRHLTAGPAVLGQTWSVTVFSEPGYATLDHTSRLGIGLARLPQPLALPGLGNLWLDLGAPFTLADAVVPANAGQVAYPFPLPAAPVLAGLPLHLQALLEQAPAAARLTDFVSVVLQ